MKKLCLVLAAVMLLLGSGGAKAANSTVSAMTAAGAFGGTELLYIVQGGLDRKGTTAQFATYIEGLITGDCTINTGTNAITCTKTNGTAFSALATTIPGTGVATFLTTPTSANLALALTDETGSGAAVFGTSPTFSTGVTFGFITGSTQCLHVNTSGVLSGTGVDCGAGGGGVTSVTPGGGLVSSVTAACSQAAITTTGTISSAECVNAQVGTTYTIVEGDRAKLITGTNAAAQAYTLPQATSAVFVSGWFTRVQNKGAGALTITPTTSTICGAATLVISPGSTYKITSDGTNYQCDSGGGPTLAISSQTGVNYAFVTGNFGQLVNLSNGSNQIPTLPQAGTTGFPAGWYTQACNQGAGTQTLTPATSTIGGAATYVLRAASAGAPVCVGIVSDGTNYQIIPDAAFGTLSGAVKADGTGQLSQAACADLSNGTALCSTTPGTGVATALAANLSAAGGVTTTIASGTSALGTGAITSATCATVVTTVATNVATTDVVTASFNGDPTAVTGYIPATAGMLTIIGYPTSGNVNFKVCNNTSSSITPGAITLNWRVTR